MRICKCDNEMEQIGWHKSGLFWCPYCGRTSQSYACDNEIVWKEPAYLKEHLKE